MDIFEFELRYKSFMGLSDRFNLQRDEWTILSLVKKTSAWNLDKELTETSVEELHDKTLDTYTDLKIEFINNATAIIPSTDKTVSEYVDRLEYELKVTHEMWYDTYFLIVEDYISRAKEHKIVVWPWRWSCAWSLMSYVIGVTDLDPLQYDLIFERFLNPARISMPDIDTDFEDTQRDKVIAYISEKYWSDKVAHIWTYMKLAAKAAYKDVARVMWVKFMDANNMANMITEKTIQKSIDENKDLQKVIKNDTRTQKIIDFAQALEGTVRQTWVHACGMIIAPESTHNYSVIQHPPKSASLLRDESRVVAQYDWNTVEDLGLLKMDLLGLRNLTIIKNTIKILNAKAKNAGEILDPLYQNFLDSMLFHPPLDDEMVYKKIFWNWDTSWVFQFESDGMKNWLKKLKPTSFDDLIAMVSLYRPGPMEFIPNYVDRKHGVEDVIYMQLDLESILRRTYSKEVAQDEKQKMEKDLWPIMNMTYGIAVYQEQLMRLSQSIAWFSMAEADKLRKWVGKKIAELIEKIKKEFVSKAMDHRQYKPETATWIYEKMIEPAARYSFNKSHAACYAYISYQTAYLKAHHPIEFHAALLRSAEENNDRLAQFIDEIKLQWYTVQLPRVNLAYEHVAAIEDKIVLWFLCIKWIWTEVAHHLESERLTNWLYIDLVDFLKRNQHHINKKSLEALIISWALDEFENRKTLWKSKDQILEWVKSLESWWQEAWLFAMTKVEWSDLSLIKQNNYTKVDHLKTEFLAYKTFVSWHPLDGLHTYIKGKYWFVSMFKDKEWYWDFSLFGYIKTISRNRRWEWFFIKVEDITWEIEFYIKDKLDLEPFMIIAVHGYMGRRPRIDKISWFSLEKVLEKSENAWNYKEELTVAKVRLDRYLVSQESQKNAPKLIQITDNQASTKNTSNTVTENEDMLSTSEDIASSKDIDNTLENIDITDISLIYPKLKNPWLKMKLKPLVVNNPWTIEVSIWEQKVLVNEIWLKKISELFG